MELMYLYVSVTLFIMNDELATACEESLYLPSALGFKTSISKCRSKPSTYREFSEVALDYFKYILLKVMETSN